MIWGYPKIHRLQFGTSYQTGWFVIYNPIFANQHVLICLINKHPPYPSLPSHLDSITLTCLGDAFKADTRFQWVWSHGSETGRWIGNWSWRFRCTVLMFLLQKNGRVVIARTPSSGGPEGILVSSISTSTTCVMAIVPSLIKVLSENSAPNVQRIINDYHWLASLCSYIFWISNWLCVSISFSKPYI